MHTIPRAWRGLLSVAEHLRDGIGRLCLLLGHGGQPPGTADIEELGPGRRPVSGPISWWCEGERRAVCAAPRAPATYPGSCATN